MIKTIIFDFGDVFINLDKPATMREMNKYKIEELSESLLDINQQYEKGLISSTEFVKYYQTEHSQLQENQFKNSWNAILIDFPEYRYQFLKKLSAEKNYKLILLSNTNEIHIDWVKENVPFFEDFKACFDAFYLSHEINFRKPDAEIYEYVLEQHDLKPEECLFIDDTKENTEAAKNLGIHTWNIEPTREDVIDLFTAKKELF
ncbi:HAD family hydrolase [Salegentibacter mishustinae]|uniref:Haloacid dehalogenase n=1 Tax=Salegentibacter mishustinae TaxID=270918 RepID=A0A0Q9ZKH0_9FLAO|nr:HAD family phosphatase [Salegentibacter mishustinae]KRG28904.1 haloacid dehalogenase [Salegentibacter mishustinae]PNW22046.1 haloacid dehalogenase [Salegentibacter mishustinae]PZX65405.1 putative hydrolase of the HAD superfamily [Salegentibacter mishustinae]GGW85264.1 haloacid dehalogenase [Salegentibacter mishustinae]